MSKILTCVFCVFCFSTQALPSFMESKTHIQEDTRIEHAVPTANHPQRTWIEVGDVLSVQVFGEDDLSLNNVTVTPSGQIQLPLIGYISVHHKDLQQVSNHIEKVYQEKAFLVEPSVRVSLVTRRPFYIAGEVKNAGAYPFTDGLTVLHAVSLAGGYTDRAKKKKVKVLRQVNPDHSRLIWLSPLDDIKPHDVIDVQERFF